MRYIIYGAGAIGGVVGCKLYQAGHEVILIARGEHLRVMKEQGLTVNVPGESIQVNIPAVAHPSEIEFRPDDVVVLTMKSQDTERALDALRALADDQTAILCCQNGVENERMALRRFANVYAMMILMPATYLESGVVETPSWPVAGVGDLGRFPKGTDETAEAISRDFNDAGIISSAFEDIMSWKYTKLYSNVANAVGAVCGVDTDISELEKMVREEARETYAAAGIKWRRTEEFNERSARFSRANKDAEAQATAGNGSAPKRGGSSTWQSLMRGAGSSEGDFLNGEIALLGRIHGVSTPANEVFQILSDRLARERKQPGSVSVEEVKQMIEERRASQTTTAK